MPCKILPKTDLIHRQKMRPLRHGGSHFVNAFWHGDQDDSDVISCCAVTTRWHCQRNHKTSFTNANYKNVTELSHYIWELRDQHGIVHDDINISWGIEQRSSKYKCGTRRCDLCLSEKTIFAMAERSSLLNRRAEIVSTCRHRTKFRYHMVKKKRPVQALNP